MEPRVTPALAARHGLSADEFSQIKAILGREPNLTELGIFSVMWSEHCSYKNSRPELKKFPTRGPSILVGAGEENAGIVDIGGGWAVAFKIESHNHPSAIEPFQGAATGVGGIIRDIFTMGARPVALANSLRFGDIRGDSPQAAANRRLFAGVVAGIAHYGNCIGIPTVAGEVYFDDSYAGNPLVNVFCLGVLRHSQIRRGHARGEGNPVFYVGAKTGRDGLAGAAFASRDLTAESREDRPAVQVGDPFMEKLLLEACLELFEHPEAVVGVQDMGAAGLTCSTCETASRAGTGIEIDLAKVPQREPGMTPYEIMLSESQERMLIIARKGHEDTVRRIMEKWDVACAEIGRVTGDGLMRVLHHGKVAAEIPARRLADEAPVYHREARQPAPPPAIDPAGIPDLADPRGALLQLLAAPTLASKRWVFEQYDHMVRNGTVVAPGGDAAVIRIPVDTPEGAAAPAFKHLAITTDCNSFHVALDPFEGGRLAVAEAARNLVCSGARPLAVTDNLNFGNPHDPEVFWRLRHAVEGVAEACRFFDTPVTGGNVSLYNQSPLGAVDPTPTIGMVGILDDPSLILTSAFKDSGDAILLLGEIGAGLGGSQYLKEIHGQKAGPCPKLDLEREKRVQDAVAAANRMRFLKSAHDCSEGGLLAALAESCLAAAPDPIGAALDLDGFPDLRLDEILFNETPSRVIVTVRRENASALLDLLALRNVPARALGEVRGRELALKRAGCAWSWPLDDLAKAWGQSLPRLMA